MGNTDRYTTATKHSKGQTVCIIHGLIDRENWLKVRLSQNFMRSDSSARNHLSAGHMYCE